MAKNRATANTLLVSLNTVTGKLIDTASRIDGYAITWDEAEDKYYHSEVLTAAAVTYEYLDSVGDVGDGAGQLLPGDYRFDTSQVNVVKHAGDTFSHVGSLSEHHAHSSNPYISVGGDITDNGNGTITISAGEAELKQFNLIDSPFIAAVIPEKTVTLTPNLNYLIVAHFNGGAPEYLAVMAASGYLYSNWDALPLATAINIGSKILINNFKASGTNAVYKAVLSQINYQPLRYLSGLSTSEVGTRGVQVTAGTVYVADEIHVVQQMKTTTGSTFTRMYVTSGTWTRVNNESVISNTTYNDVATGLVTLSSTPERWLTKWLYYVVDSPSIWILLEGQNVYTSLSAAQAAGTPSSTPPELSPYYAGAILVAKIIVSTNQTNIVEIQNPFVKVFQTTASASHDSLSGINLAASGITYGHISAAAQTIAGLKTFSSQVSSPNFVSTVATGTSPYASSSTTLNTNLNADLLDDNHGSYYLNRSNHTGTQLSATISDFSASVSANSDVAANTSARHVAVTVNDSSTIDFTASGTNNQTITASVIQSGISLINLGEKSLSSLTNADDIKAIEALSTTGLARRTGTNTWDLLTDNSTNWNNAYSYSQIGHLPLSGGTLTGALNGTSATFTGTVTAPTFAGALTGNASTATKLATARTIWGQSFDGSAYVSGDITLGNSQLIGANAFTGDLDTYYPATAGGIRVGSFTAAATNKPVSYDNANGIITINTANANYFHQLAFQNDGNIYWRRNNGGTITSWFNLWSSNNSNLTTKPWAASNLTLAGSITGATTITASGLATLSGGISSTSATFTGTVTAPTFAGALTGNAATATKLATARTIWGQSFDGSANVSGALTGVTDVTASGSVTAPTFVGNLSGTASNATIAEYALDAIQLTNAKGEDSQNAYMSRDGKLNIYDNTTHLSYAAIDERDLKTFGVGSIAATFQTSIYNGTNTITIGVSPFIAYGAEVQYTTIRQVKLLFTVSNVVSARAFKLRVQNTSSYLELNFADAVLETINSVEYLTLSFADPSPYYYTSEVQIFEVYKDGVDVSGVPTVNKVAAMIAADMEIYIDFVDVIALDYTCPYGMKITSVVSESTAPTLSPVINTNMAQFDTLTITPSAAGLVILKATIL